MAAHWTNGGLGARTGTGPRVAVAMVAIWVGLVAGQAAPAAAGPRHDADRHGHHHHDHGESDVRRVEHAERYRPTPMPDRIVLTWSGDPRTTQSVTWRTSTEVRTAFAEIAPADHGPAFAKAATRRTARTVPFTTDLSNAHVHTVAFDGLEPGTTYAYRVGDGTNWSEWLQFRTEPASSEPFTFVYLGDAQNDILSMWSRVTREAFRDAPRAAFFLHAGDLVDIGDSDGEWGEWFEAGAFINATIPVIATPGNHEYVRDRSSSDGRASDGRARKLTDHFDAVFAFPDNGPSGLEASVYTIDYGDLRVVSLNSNERQEDQVEWLDRVLAENDRTWTVVTFHHPVFSTGRGRDNPRLRELWKPIFDRHGVDLVLNGHDHTYGRSGTVGDAETRNVPTGMRTRAEAGTVYVVSVSGPKMYDANPEPGIDYVRRAEDTQLYQVITIDGDVLSYEARTAIGDLYDAFELRKRADGPAALTEIDVEMPARRRARE